MNFTTVACRISSRLKRYKNCKNWLRLAKVIVKNKMSRFFIFHCVYGTQDRIIQVAQLSQRDRAAACISYGQKWKTGTGVQYLWTFRSVFTVTYLASKAIKFGENAK